MLMTIHLTIVLLGFSREREAIERIHYKELDHVIIKDDKFKLCSVSQQPGDPGQTMVHIKSSLLETSLYLAEVGLFVPSKT